MVFTDFGGINSRGNVSFETNGNRLTLRAPSTLSSTYTIVFPTALPPAKRALSLEANGNIVFDTVADFSGSQPARSFFAAPSGASGAPNFRTLVFNDIQPLIGTAANTLCAGNDFRIHNQNSDIGTISQSFQFDSNDNGPRLKNNAGVLQLRNAADTAFAVLQVDEIISRIQTISDTSIINFQDAELLLNSAFTTGTPTVNLGLEGLRGSQPSARLHYAEGNGWMAGITGNMLRLGRVFQQNFVFSDLVGGILTVNHGLRRQIVNVYLVRPGAVAGTFERIGAPDGVTYLPNDVVTINMTNFGAIAGTWVVVCEG